ncbi:MAG: bifunctional folylpolyglutamate synthase/dihydrofolate synthase, partial [Deltaproteobacteria bacterium]|nr:bifunctional folylpolyglutamate synthase/dihydrofolate synthase [Deltaproteobacteria bacterium]
SAVLTRSGYSVGVYTSPHLVRINERFCINGRPVSDAEVLEAFTAVHATEKPREGTFFEYTTAMAFTLFARHGVDWAVVETGMGGRLDATNVITPALCIITNISLEHREYLGNTVAAIAGEKAGIVKPGVPVVSGVRQPSAKAAVRRAVETNRAPLLEAGRDFAIRRNKNGGFSWSGPGGRLSGLSVGLPGPHQADNAALVVAGCHALAERGARIPEQALRQGIAEARWPGRMETVCEHPRVILDGAHNLAAMQGLVKTLKRELSGKKPVVVVAGFLDDKPWARMLELLFPLAREVILCQPRINRAVPAKDLVSVVPEGVSRRVAPSVAKALETALAAAGQNGVVLCAGSLYVVGEAREALEKMGKISGFEMG